MPRLHAEPLLFCLAWAALALAAAMLIGIWTGILFSVGLAFLLMPLSATIVSRTENMTLERQARWGLLSLAALVLALWSGLSARLSG
jgi:hypothetical protein